MTQLTPKQLVEDARKQVEFAQAWNERDYITSSITDEEHEEREDVLVRLLLRLDAIDRVLP